MECPGYGGPAAAPDGNRYIYPGYDVDMNSITSVFLNYLAEQGLLIRHVLSPVSRTAHNTSIIQDILANSRRINRSLCRHKNRTIASFLTGASCRVEAQEVLRRTALLTRGRPASRSGWRGLLHDQKLGADGFPAGLNSMLDEESLERCDVPGGACVEHGLLLVTWW